MIQWGKAQSQYVNILNYTAKDTYLVFSHVVRATTDKHQDGEVYFAYTNNQIYRPRMMSWIVSIEYLTIGY